MRYFFSWAHSQFFNEIFAKKDTQKVHMENAFIFEIFVLQISNFSSLANIPWVIGASGVFDPYICVYLRFFCKIVIVDHNSIN